MVEVAKGRQIGGDLITKEKCNIDGFEYEGQWTRDGKREGRGIQIWPDGKKYEGQWQ